MKKMIVLGVVSILCIFLLGGIATAGIDLSGEFTYDMDTKTRDGYTEIVTPLNFGPLGFTFTWNRVWLPSILDSLKLNAGITKGLLSLNFERELLKDDIWKGTISLSKEPVGIQYTRQLDGIDSGTFTITLVITPLTFEYVRSLDDDALGTIKLSFAKSFS